VGSNNYVGLGNSSTDMLRNTVVVPTNMIVTKMVFSIRELAQNTPYTATLVINGIPSNFKSVITNGSITKVVSTTGTQQLNQEDLITIMVTWNGGALSRGLTISLLASGN
jgi:hypothetical protein